MPDQISEILEKKHGIGNSSQIITACHDCGFVLETIQESQPFYRFPNGKAVYFCNTIELNDWKLKYKIL